MANVADGPSPESCLFLVQRGVGEPGGLLAEVSDFNSLTGVIDEFQKPVKLFESSSCRAETLVGWGVGQLVPDVIFDRHWNVACSSYTSTDQCLPEHSVVPCVSSGFAQAHEAPHTVGKLAQISDLVGESLHGVRRLAAPPLIGILSCRTASCGSSLQKCWHGLP
jgi:hypothetical protein